MNSFIIKGCICWCSPDRQLLTRDDAYLISVDGVSMGVFDDIPAEYSKLPVIDHSGKLVIPGMVDMHIHAPQFTYRGTGMDMELLDWLQNCAFPEEAKYADSNYADKAYDIFADAMTHSATTRACIFASRHSGATVQLMEKMEKSGLVSYVGKVNMDRAAPDILREESAEASAADTRAWLDAVNGRFSRCFPIITPRFVPSCSDELMKELGRICKEYNLPVQSHLSENLGEVEFVRELRPDAEFYGKAYDNDGLFGTPGSGSTVMAHCVWSGQDELELMKRNGVFIAHCPASNTNIASGIAPIRRYLDMDMNVCLGSDVAGGHTESMFRAISDAIQVSKLYWRLVDTAVKPLSFPEAFYLSTVGGGKFFGKVGSFDAGYELDAVVLDDSLLPTAAAFDTATRLERAVYLGLDKNGICGKYVKGCQTL